MHISQALALCVAASSARAAVTYGAYTTHIAIVENDFYVFEQKLQTIVDLKSGYRATNVSIPPPARDLPLLTP
jgi:hypothetical protein